MDLTNFCFRQSLKTFLFGQWEQCDVSTYLLTYWCKEWTVQTPIPAYELSILNRA